MYTQIVFQIKVIQQECVTLTGQKWGQEPQGSRLTHVLNYSTTGVKEQVLHEQLHVWHLYVGYFVLDLLTVVILNVLVIHLHRVFIITTCFMFYSYVIIIITHNLVSIHKFEEIIIECNWDHLHGINVTHLYYICEMTYSYSFQ